MSNLTDTDFLEVINFIGSREKKAAGKFIPMTSLNQGLSDTGADSLDIMMFYVILDDAFAIPEDKIEESVPEEEPTGNDIFDFVKKYQTKGFTIEELRETFKQYK